MTIGCPTVTGREGSQLDRGVSGHALSPMRKIRIVLRENADKYRGINNGLFEELLSGLKAQKVPW